MYVAGNIFAYVESETIREFPAIISEEELSINESIYFGRCSVSRVKTQAAQYSTGSNATFY